MAMLQPTRITMKRERKEFSIIKAIQRKAFHNLKKVEILEILRLRSIH